MFLAELENIQLKLTGAVLSLLFSVKLAGCVVVMEPSCFKQSEHCTGLLLLQKKKKAFKCYIACQQC